MRSHHEFGAHGVIAVFIGGYRSEAKLLDDLEGEFLEEHFDGHERQ